MRAIASIVLQDGITILQRNRDDTGDFAKQNPVSDLFVDGQNTPDFIRRVAELKGGWCWDAVVKRNAGETDRILLDRDAEWVEESVQDGEGSNMDGSLHEM